QEGIELIPVMYAEATPGGTVSSETYKILLEDLMLEVEKVLPVDAFLVVPHGAGVSENYHDMDGHWLSQLRAKAGDEIPIIGTIDLHANVSPLMTASTNALITYKQNPHTDQRERGKEAAGMLVKFLRNKIKPVQILIQVPVAISIEQQLTDNEPCKSLYAYAEELSRQEDILSISIQLGFPYADVQDMGTSIIVVSNNNKDKALAAGKKLEFYLIDNRERFIGYKNDIPSSLALIRNSKKPVLLLDMGDNIGGGGPGNNSCILEAFENSKKYKYFICMYDPNAVTEATKYKAGDIFNLSITGTGRNGVKTQIIKVTLVQLTDGNFTEEKPRHGGQVNFKMGKTAIVSTEQGSIIMLTSLRAVPFSLKQLTSSNIVPGDFDAIVAKGVNAPVAAYSGVCPTIIQVDTPGVTQADMTLFNYRYRRRPLFPFENG
ncbi:MAG: M81 family metallopeptidase, partial [Chitinophagaceae bacterium]